MQDRLALAALFGFAVGVLIASVLSFPFAFVALASLLSAGFFIAWFFGRRDAYLYPTLFLLLLALGAGRTLLAPRTLPPAFLPMLANPVSLAGTIVADPDRRESSERITVAIVEGNVRTKVLAVADPYGDFAAGDEVIVEGTLTTPEAFATDGGREFGYRMYLAKDGIMAMVPHAHLAKTGLSRDPFLRALRALYSVKHAFSRALEDALPEPHASLAEGLITGGKQGLGSALLAAFTIAGLLPIVVLSGYNVMIVADAVLAGLSFLSRRFSVALAGITILLFVLAAGGGASAARAGVMAGLALFARATGRTYDALRALLAAFVLMLLFNPFSLAFDSGFQFSFAAALGLVLLSSPLERMLVRIRWMALREIIATTLAAQLLVLPLLLYQTGNLSLVALPANILVLPVVPLAMGLSAFAGAIALLVPPLALAAGLPAYAALSYIIFIAEEISRVPFAHVIIPAFSAAFLVIMYGGIAWLASRIRKAAPVRAAPVPAIVAVK